MENLEGQTFAGYEVHALLGRGGMGTVYRARQPLLDRIVALKVMAEHTCANPGYVARFIREAASAANLRHPNIVEVFTAGEHNGVYYMAMEFVEGESLRTRLERLGRIAPQEAVAITIHVAQALQHAWNTIQLVHRDIKPDNIFLSNAGEVKVGDLGLAKSISAESTELTQFGEMMGSPHYVSPEQTLAAKDLDFRADIYSLGCTLYHMLTGQTPYHGDTSVAVLMKHVHGPAPAIFKVWPECPLPLGILVGKMLAKDPNARHQSYEQLIAELFEVNQKLQQLPAPAPAAEPAPATAPRTTPAAGAATATQALAPSAAAKIARWSPRLSVPLLNRLKPELQRALLIGVPGVIALAGLLLWSPWTRPSSQYSGTPTLQHSASTAAASKLLGPVYENAVGAEMVYVPPGEFLLGSTKEEQDWAMANAPKTHLPANEGEQPRKTHIQEGLWMGRTEVTVGQWKQFVSATGFKTDAETKGAVGYAPRKGQSWGEAKGLSWRDPGFGTAPQDRDPVSCISWNDAMAFCGWLTEQERKAGRLPAGRVVRLPAEAEWEYACRAGTQTKFWWGENTEDGEDRLNKPGTEDGFEYVAPVDNFGERGRNGFGLADMLGNVWEWCLDHYDAKQAHEECYLDSPTTRVMRGGAFDPATGFCRCALRHHSAPDRPASTYGFRVCLGPDVPGSAPAATNSGSE